MADTHDRQLGLDWLWIANPFIPDDDKNEDHYKFIESGTARLQILSQFMEAGNKSGRSPFVVKKEIFKEREAAIQDLRTLAADCNVLSGKWMLFPEPDTVNEVWRAVAHATARNELGIVAKVDTRASSGKERLICVYTSDFRDKDDVARVLNRLRQLELVRQGGRPIYYKSGQLFPNLDKVFLLTFSQMLGLRSAFMEEMSGRYLPRWYVICRIVVVFHLT